MHGRGTLILLVVVGVLFGLTQWNDDKKIEDERIVSELGQSAFILAGMEATDLDRLKMLRIDNLRNGVQVSMERDRAGRWYLTDPIAWPADTSVLSLLFRTLSQTRGIEVHDVTSEAAGLEPAFAICDLTFSESKSGDPGGTWRIELGDPDLNPARMFLASTGPDGKRRVLRVSRTLESIFQRFIPDYRSKEILRFQAEDIVAFERTGPEWITTEISLGAQAVLGPPKPKVPNPLLRGESWEGLNLNFISDKLGWRLTEPVEGRIDPQALTMLLTTLANLDCTGFYAESAQIPGLFGFDDPEVVIDLHSANGARHHIEFARTPEEREASALQGFSPDNAIWLCRIDGRPTVFEVASNKVMLAAGPASSFFDYRILRGILVEADSFEYTAGGRMVKLEHVHEGAVDQWFVSGRTAGGNSLDRLPAADDIALDFLKQFRQAELGALRPAVELPPLLVGESLTVEMYGMRSGGDFAPDPSPREGSTGILFRRFGDGVCVEVAASIRDLLTTGAEHFLDRRVHQVEELTLGSVELKRGDEILVFARSTATGKWIRQGQSEEDRAFGLVMDRLRSMKALGWELDERPSLLDGIEVQLNIDAVPGSRGRAAGQVRFVVGNGTGGMDPCETQAGEGEPDRGRALLFPGLWASLDALFKGER